MTILVEQERHEELLKKETTLEIIKILHSKMSDYVFRDAVGHLLKTEVKTDE